MSMPMPPNTHPATTTGHIPADGIGPLPPHMADIGSPERMRIGSPAECLQNSIQRVRQGSPAPVSQVGSPGRSNWSYGNPSQPAMPMSAAPQSYVQQPSHVSAAPVSYAPSAGSPSATQPAGSPARGMVSGPTYEQEVNSFLDQTSPARIREQTPSVLPNQQYMAGAQHEAQTQENSPARARGSSPAPMASQPMVSAAPQSYAAPVSAAPQSYVQQPSHVSAAPQSYAAPVSAAPQQSFAAPVSAAPQSAYPQQSYAAPVSAAPQQSYATGALPLTGQPGEGESPRRLAAWGESCAMR